MSIEKKILLAAFCVGFGLNMAAQSPIPLKSLQTAVNKPGTEGDNARQVGVTDGNGKQRYVAYTDVLVSPIGYTPAATGNTINLSRFVQRNDSIWYIDFEGDSKLLKVPGGGAVNDADWLKIRNNGVPYSITDSIYTLKTVSINGRNYFPDVELNVYDSTSVFGATVASIGNRGGRFAGYNTVSGAWSSFGQEGSIAQVYGGAGTTHFSISEVTGTSPGSPSGTFEQHFELDLVNNNAKFNKYPNTRNDAGTPVNVLTTSATGVVESHPVGEFRDSLGYAWRLSSSYSSLQAAFNSPYNIVVDRSYTVTATLTVTVPKTIKGQGNITIKQVTAATSGTPIILVTASGVTIDGLKLVGQIATQTSEFSHGISLGSSIFTGMLENITVKNCEIRDCRGDGIYVASDGTIEPKNIAIQNIVARNILRNGVAVINGDNITIDGLLADSIGLYGIDVEPDATAQTNSNISINSIVVPSIGYGTHLGTQVNLNVTATNFVIDGDMYGSNPEYTVAPAYQAGKRGISIRADYNATLKGGIVKNCEYAAIELSAGGGKIKNILFEDIVFSNNGTAISGRVIDVSGGDYRNQVTFRDCDITGTGGTHLGPPDQSIWEHCKITGFTRISVAEGIKMNNCDVTVSGTAFYLCAAPIRMTNTKLSCDMLYQNPVTNTDTMSLVFTGNNFTFASATPVVMNGATNLSMIWNENIVNGAKEQTITATATAITDRLNVTSVGAVTITIPTWLRHPANTIKVSDAAVDGNITVVGEGSTVNHAASVTFTGAKKFYSNTSNWFFDKAIIGANNGLSESLGVAQLGNSIGSTTAALTNDRTIPLGSRAVRFTDSDTTSTSMTVTKDYVCIGSNNLIGTKQKAMVFPIYGLFMQGNNSPTTFSGDLYQYIRGNGNNMAKGNNFIDGFNNTVTGTSFSFTIGRLNVVNGSNTLITQGLQNTNSGNSTTVVGSTNTATSGSVNAGIFGYNSVTSANEAFAFGSSATSSALRAFALGYNSAASAPYSFALGQSAASGYYSFAGQNGTASDTFAVSLMNTIASGDYSFSGGELAGAVKPTASGRGAFAFYGTDNNQTAGYGALAARSAILGGRNHNLPVGFDNCVILGGNQVRPTVTKTNFAFVPSLSIFTTPATATLTGSSTALIRDAASEGETKVATLAAIITAGGAVTSLAAVGSTPNANAATITGSTLNLEPASATHKGVISLTQLKFPLKMTVVDGNTDVPGAGLQTYEVIRIPACYDGYSISDVSYGVHKTGATGTAEMQIRKNGSGTAGVTWTAGQGVKDVTLTGVTVATGDIIDVEIISNSMATPQQGLWVTIFLTPH